MCLIFSWLVPSYNFYRFFFYHLHYGEKKRKITTTQSKLINQKGTDHAMAKYRKQSKDSLQNTN